MNDFTITIYESEKHGTGLYISFTILKEMVHELSGNEFKVYFAIASSMDKSRVCILSQEGLTFLTSHFLRYGEIHSSKVGD